MKPGVRILRSYGAIPAVEVPWQKYWRERCKSVLEFLYGNLATILIGLVVLALVLLAVRSIWRDKKQGRSCGSCPGGCSGCSGCGAGGRGNAASDARHR